MLEINDLVRTFGDKIAVDHVSLTVPDGQMVGFVGGNGAGKTTTMRMVMGALQQDSGTVSWDGVPVTAAVRRTFGYMPEERGLYPKQPILAQLAYLGQLQGMNATNAHTSALNLLDRFDLGERAKDNLESLSLGNQQRVQIASALISSPRLLVLDEPFSGLDPGAVDSMVDLLREHTARGAGVLFSSHQLDLVERLSDQLVIMAAGRVKAAGTADELRNQGPVRYRLVMEPDTTWVHQLGWARVIHDDATGCVIELPEPTMPDRLVREAVTRGRVHELSKLVPTMADIYREAAA